MSTTVEPLGAPLEALELDGVGARLAFASRRLGRPATVYLRASSASSS